MIKRYGICIYTDKVYEEAEVLLVIINNFESG